MAFLDDIEELDDTAGGSLPAPRTRMVPVGSHFSGGGSAAGGTGADGADTADAPAPAGTRFSGSRPAASWHTGSPADTFAGMMGRPQGGTHRAAPVPAPAAQGGAPAARPAASAPSAGPSGPMHSAPASVAASRPAPATRPSTGEAAAPASARVPSPAPAAAAPAASAPAASAAPEVPAWTPRPAGKRFSPAAGSSLTRQDPEAGDRPAGSRFAKLGEAAGAAKPSARFGSVRQPAGDSFKNMDTAQWISLATGSAPAPAAAPSPAGAVASAPAPAPAPSTVPSAPRAATPSAPQVADRPAAARPAASAPVPGSVAAASASRPAAPSTAPSPAVRRPAPGAAPAGTRRIDVPLPTDPAGGQPAEPDSDAAVTASMPAQRGAAAATEARAMSRSDRRSSKATSAVPVIPVGAAAGGSRGHAGASGSGTPPHGPRGGSAGKPSRGGRGRGSIISTVLIVIGVALLLVAGGLFVSAQLGYRQAQQTYAELQQYAVSSDSGDGVPDVDFDALAAINPDIVGWIYIPDTVVNYPVVQTDDNTTYLDLLFDRSGNGSGTIFMDMDDTAPGMVDQQTTIYGHHMYDGSMLKVIDNTTDQAEFDKIQHVYYITRDTTYVLTPLLTAQVEDTFVDARKTDFTGEGESLQGYLEEMQTLARAQASDATERIGQITDDDHVLSLVTCAGEIIPRTTRAVMVLTVDEEVARQ